jgi:hypothetical protein
MATPISASSRRSSGIDSPMTLLGSPTTPHGSRIQAIVSSLIDAADQDLGIASDRHDQLSFCQVRMPARPSGYAVEHPHECVSRSDPLSNRR